MVEEHPDKLAVIRADLVRTNNDWNKWDFPRLTEALHWRLTEKETYFRKGYTLWSGPRPVLGLSENADPGPLEKADSIPEFVVWESFIFEKCYGAHSKHDSSFLKF